jgi:hypothetical protein
MPVSWDVGFVVFRIDTGFTELTLKFARKRVMHFEFTQTALTPDPCDFFVQACDIALAGNPVRTAERLKLWIVRIQLSQGSVRIAVKQQPNALGRRQLWPTGPTPTAARPHLRIARTRDQLLYICVG